MPHSVEVLHVALISVLSGFHSPWDVAVSPRLQIHVDLVSDVACDVAWCNIIGSTVCHVLRDSVAPVLVVLLDECIVVGHESWR